MHTDYRIWRLINLTTLKDTCTRSKAYSTWRMNIILRGRGLWELRTAASVKWTRISGVMRLQREMRRPLHWSSGGSRGTRQLHSHALVGQRRHRGSRGLREQWMQKRQCSEWNVMDRMRENSQWVNRQGCNSHWNKRSYCGAPGRSPLCIWLKIDFSRLATLIGNLMLKVWLGTTVYGIPLLMRKWYKSRWALAGQRLDPFNLSKFCETFYNHFKTLIINYNNYRV